MSLKVGSTVTGQVCSTKRKRTSKRIGVSTLRYPQAEPQRALAGMRRLVVGRAGKRLARRLRWCMGAAFTIMMLQAVGANLESPPWHAGARSVLLHGGNVSPFDPSLARGEHVRSHCPPLSRPPRIRRDLEGVGAGPL